MNAAHIHLLLNHFPIIGLIIGILVLILGIILKSNDTKRVSLYVFILSALISIPVYLSGEPAEEIVENLSGISESMIEEHEEFALFSFISIGVLGLLSLTILFIFRRGKAISQSYLIVIFIVSLIVVGLMTWTGNLGGKISHSEIRSGETADTAVAGQAESHSAENEIEDHD